MKQPRTEGIRQRYSLAALAALAALFSEGKAKKNKVCSENEIGSEDFFSIPIKFPGSLYLISEENSDSNIRN